jgi:beta-galactosidase
VVGARAPTTLSAKSPGNSEGAIINPKFIWRFFMRRCLFAVTSVVAFLMLAATRPGPDAPVPPEIEDEQMLGINKLPYHATLMPYANRAEALAANRDASSWRRSLNGPWKFNYVPRPEQRPVEFYRPSYDVSSWKEIPVPSNWQVFGYGTPYYRNSGYIIRRDWPRVMSEPPKNWTAYEERDPVGSYRRDFDLPANWNGRCIFITFDGVDSAFFLWINGEKVGFSVNSRNAAEFDITPYVKPGKNMVAVEVYRFSAGTYLEDQDMWRLSGIFRNVTLWSAPQVHIRDFFIRTDLDAQYRDASLAVSAEVHNYSDQPAPARKLTVDLSTRAGRPIAGASATVDVPALNAGEEQAVSLAIPVANPAKWTAEMPNLYTTVLTLSGRSAGEQEIISARTGFRKVEIKGPIFMINGVPVKLKGANRHEMWPDTGHYVSEERMIRDLELLKQVNANHVRTSHYSDDPRWYELCDEYGIYLVAEANVECHGYMGVLDREPRWEKAIVDRNVANVENFKNHPSVIIWSLGNENGNGRNFVTALRAIKAIDPDRPSHYQGFGIGQNNPTDIDSQMYTAVNLVENAGKDPNRTKPFYLCEYAHAMNNSMGAVGEYNDLFDKYPNLMGGAIWEWEDQGLWNRRDPKRQFIAYGGGFGEVPNDHYFIHKGVVFSDRSPKPHYPELKRAYQWIGFEPEDLASGKIRIRNEYAFLNLNRFVGGWTLSEDGKVIDRGSLGRLDLAPGATTLVNAPFKKIVAKPGAEYFLQLSFVLAKDELWAKAGYDIASTQFKLPVVAPAAVSNASLMKPVKVTQDARFVTIEGDAFRVVFDKTEGGISQIARDGISLLVPGSGPKMYFYRAPHRIDDEWAERDWKAAGIDALQPRVVSFKAEQAGPSAVRVESVINADGRNGWSATHSAVYTVYGDGSIVVANAIAPQGRRIALARLGVRMQLDKRFDRFTYLGRGPMENYADRKRGFDVGLYSSTVRQQLTPYAKPMECGNHEDVRWAALQGANLPGLIAQSDGPMQVSALPYTDEQMAPPEYSIDLPESSAAVVTLSVRTLGVGTASCGPRPLDQYITWSDPVAFTYTLRLIPQGVRDLSSVARLAAPQDQVKPVLGQRDNFGKVTLACNTPGARVEYFVDGSTWQPYTSPFEFKQAGVISLRATAQGLRSFNGAIALGPYDHRSAWKVVSASSSLRGDGDPANMIDGNPQTAWRARPRSDVSQPPHNIVLDFGGELTVSTVLYTARSQDPGGRVRDYEIYLSEDGKDWGQPVAKSALPAEPLQQTVRLAQPAKGRYLKFVVLSEHTAGNGAAIAELDVR